MRINKKYAEQRISELTKELNIHNHRYYLLNAPTISDFEYDILMQELITLEKLYPELLSDNSPSKRVGSDLSLSNGGDNLTEDVIAVSFEQAPHKYPMLSLSNTYEFTELYAFDERIRKVIDEPYTYCCELKFDGTAICLTYLNGELSRALTRGDGTVGDIVTTNVKTIKGIPQRVLGAPAEFEIRGEIFMPYDAFDRLNAEREEQEEAPFANPRNAAAGSLKLLDPGEVRKRGLECVLYHILGENIPFNTHYEALLAAKKWGFPTSEYSKIFASLDEVISFIKEWDEKRKTLPFATDGMVIKINELDIQKRLGVTAKSPRWATAYKFKPEDALTKLLSIDYQVGRTGAITPVANLEPVQLSGTVVKRASLHNAEQMELLDIRINDFVYVEKGGEIIPKITGVELSKRCSDSMVPTFPSNCPDCGSLLVKDEAEAKHYCLNSDNCPTQIKARFVHFSSRKAMNIIAGDATVEQLYSKGFIKELSDLYKLTKEELLTLEGWKERSAERFLESLEESKKAPFGSVLFALGIRYIGETTAKMLASHFKNIDTMMNASKEELLTIDEVGEKVAESIIAYFAEPRHTVLVQELRGFGLNFEEDETKTGKVSDKLNNNIIVITGNFSVSREDIKDIISKNGGKNSGSVSGNTTYLLAGEKPGPEKMKKAEKLGIRIISEEDFYKLLK